MLKRDQTGVTIIEMMIAIALVTLMLLFALPMFNSWIANLRVRSVAEGVTSGLQLARVEALKRNTTVRFRLDSATGGAWTVLVVSGGAVIEQKAAGQGGTANVDISPNDGSSVDFGGTGQRVKPGPNDGVVTVSITKPDAGTCQEFSGSVRCLSISVPVGGQVRMCDPARPDGDPQACL